MAKDGAQAVIVQGFFGPFASRIVQIATQAGAVASADLRDRQ